jgi:HPt (histidine-containing phosphotransfer) domain-containing protein
LALLVAHLRNDPMRPTVGTRALPISSSAPPPEVALAWALPSSLPGFDVAGARNRLGGNTVLLGELLRAFAGEHAHCAERIDALLRDQRPATAAAELHRLKSAARIIGAQALAQAAEALESDIRHGRLVDSTAFGRALSDAVSVIGAQVTVGHDHGVSDRPDANRS